MVSRVQTHTLRAFCRQTSRAVTPTIMTTRNVPALTPSITPLRGSAGTKKHTFTPSEQVNRPFLDEEGASAFELTGLGDHRQRQECVGEERGAVGVVVSVLVEQLRERSDAEPSRQNEGHTSV